MRIVDDSLASGGDRPPRSLEIYSADFRHRSAKEPLYVVRLDKSPTTFQVDLSRKMGLMYVKLRGEDEHSAALVPTSTRELRIRENGHMIADDCSMVMEEERHTGGSASFPFDLEDLDDADVGGDACDTRNQLFQSLTELKGVKWIALGILIILVALLVVMMVRRT